MNIDVHTHAIPQEIIDLIRKDPVKSQADIVDVNGQRFVYHDQGFKYPLHRGFYDMSVRLKDMDSREIDIDMISISPTIFYYWADLEFAREICMIANNSIASIAKTYPDRFIPVATVPLQNVPAAIEELTRVVKEHGYRAVEIGTSVEGCNFDEPEFLPFFKKCEELGVVVIFHPYYVGDRLNLGDYYLTNLIGNPLDTTICIARLIFGGVLKECPKSKFIFAHAGGYIPYQRGRLQHGFKVRNEPRIIIQDDTLEEYFDSLNFDTITHWDNSLKYLIESHGSQKVMLGTDYPYDMADDDPVRRIFRLNLSKADQDNVLGKSIFELLSR